MRLPKKKRLSQLFFFAAIMLFSAVKFNMADRAVTTFSMPTNKKVVVLDAGHGGWDPGMVTKSGVEEKDINLQITEKLQALFEQGGAYVLVTRADDSALGNRKKSDMNGRRNIVDTSEADILISIHQNSFLDPDVSGAQVFYYGDSEKSKVLAENIQGRIRDFIGIDRTAKANNAYYLLKRTSVPSVIVECGFLSNITDRKMLLTDDYQERVAWAVYLGAVRYFNENNE